MKKFLLLLFCLLGAMGARAQNYNVTFEITDIYGQPVFDGVSVIANGMEERTKNGTGRVTFFLPDGEYTYRMYVYSQYGNTYLIADYHPFTVAGKNITIPVRFYSPLSFTVTGAGGEQIKEGVNVTIANKNGNTGYAFSNPDGNYMFYIPAGEYTFRLTVPGYPDQTGELTVADGVALDKNVSVASATHYPVVFHVTGVDETYIGNIYIYLNDVLFAGADYIDGKYTVYLPDGKYTYATNTNSTVENARYGNKRGEFTVAGKAPDPVTLSYENFSTLTVTAVDHTGAALERGSIYVSNQANFASVPLDGTGKALLHLPDGEYNYRYFPGNYGYWANLYPRQAGTLTINGAKAKTISYAMGYFPVEITQTDQNGAPYGNLVRIYKGTENSYDLVTPNNTTGKATIYLANGDYSYYAEIQGVNKTGFFTVSGAGKQLSINPADDSGYAVTFNVTGVDGQALQYGYVHTINKANGNQKNADIYDGVANIRLAGGEYSYTVHYNDYVYPAQSLAVSGNKQVDVKFADITYYSVKFTFQDNSGNPMEYMGISIHDSKGEYLQDGYTHDPGEATVMLPNGTYTYTTGGSNGFPERTGSFTVNNANPATIAISYKTGYYAANFTLTGITGDIPYGHIYIYTNEKEIAYAYVEDGEGTVYLPNGTYRYEVSIQDGYASKTGELVINNTAKNVTVSYADYYPVTFTVTGYDGKPANVNLGIFKNGEYIAGKYGEEDLTLYLPAGDYFYETGGENSGLPVKTAQFTKTAAAQTILVAYEAGLRYPVTFICKNPAGAILPSSRVALKDEYQNVSIVYTGLTGMGGVIDLPNGNYTYDASGITGQIAVRGKAQQVEITIASATVGTVEFVWVDNPSNLKLTVYNESGTEVFRGENSNYNYIVVNLPAGKYSYRAYNNGDVLTGQVEITNTPYRLYLKYDEAIKYKIDFTGKNEDGSPLDKDYFVVVYGEGGVYVRDTGLPGSLYLSPGKYTYEAMIDGGGGVSQKGSFTADKAQTVNISVKPSTLVTFNIKAEGKDAMAYIMLADGSGNPITAGSIYGSAAAEMARGTYTCKVDMPGYAAVNQPFTVGATATTVNINLTAVRVTGISLDRTAIGLLVGKNYTLHASLTPSDALNQEVTWSSDNASVAKVSASGVVTAVAAGATNIKVTSADGAKQATCSVTVSASEVAVSSITVGPTNLNMNAGTVETLKATILPAAATNQKVKWSSSNTAVASVDAYGNVMAKAEGSATITATTDDGSKTATCTVQVANVAVTGVTLAPASLNLMVDEYATLTATINPANASNQKVTWSSSAPDVASVAEGRVTALKAGSATITVTTTDGGKTATCSVTVTAKVAVTGLSLNKPTTTIVIGDNEQLTATVAPANATNTNVSWATSNEAIATVDATGTVTGVSAGTATITVSTVDGNKTATCTVTVTSETTGVEIADAPLAIMYPNPTDGAFTLAFDAPGTYRVTITNMAGKVLFRQTVSDLLKQMDISSYPAGVYLILINDGKRQSTTKIVKK